MVTASTQVSRQSLVERIDRYNTTLDRLRTEGADKRIISSWEVRIKKLNADLAELKSSQTTTATDVDQSEEATMPGPTVKTKPTAKDQAKAKQAQVAKSKAKTPAKASTATPVKPNPTPRTQTAPAKQTPRKPAPVTQKPVSAKAKAQALQAKTQAAKVKKVPAKAATKTSTNGVAKGIPGKNHIVYPDLNKTDPTFGGRGTTHCMCGCGVPNKRGGKFQPGHDNRFRMMLRRIERGEEGGDSIAESTLVDCRENKSLTVGAYSTSDIITLSTRKLRARAMR